MKKLSVLGIILTAFLVACPTPPPVTISVSPNAVSLNVGAGSLAGTQTFSASLNNSTETITWTLTPPLGTLSDTTGSSVSYTAPATLPAGTTTQAITLRASVGNISNSAVITLLAPAVPALSISPTTATLMAGGQSQTLTATLTNSTSSINWSLNPNIGTLSATTSTSNNPIIYTPPATLTTATTVTVNVAADSKTASAVLTINPPATITVAGTVTSVEDIGLGDWSVKINNLTPVITNSTGNFTVPNVAVPYTLSAYNAATKQVYTFIDLTNPAPKISTFVSSPRKSADLYVTVTGNNVAANECQIGAFGAESGIGRGRSYYDASNFYMNPTWLIGDTTTGKTHVLRWLKTNPAASCGDSSNYPASYSGYGVVNTPLVDGGAVAKNVDLTTVSTKDFTFDVAKPADHQFGDRRIQLVFSPQATIVTHTGVTAASASLKIPGSGIPNLKVIAAATALKGNGFSYTWAKVDASSPGTSLTIAPIPQLIAPANNGTGITTNSQFVWSSSEGDGIYYASFLPDDPNNPTFYVFSSQPSIKIPNLASIGIELPKNAGYSWGTATSYQAGSLDTADRGVFFDYFKWSSFQDVSKGGAIAVTGSYRFITAP